MSKIILPEDVQQAQSVFQQQAAEEEMQQEMLMGIVQMCTQNVIGNLLNSNAGFVFYDENGKQTDKGRLPVKNHERDSLYSFIAEEDILIPANSIVCKELRLGFVYPAHTEAQLYSEPKHCQNGVSLVNSIVIEQSQSFEPISLYLGNAGKQDYIIKAGEPMAKIKFYLRSAAVEYKYIEQEVKSILEKMGIKK